MKFTGEIHTAIWLRLSASCCGSAFPTLPTPLHPLPLPFPAPDQWFQLAAASFPQFCCSIDLCDCDFSPPIIIVSIPTPGALHKYVCVHTCVSLRERQRESRECSPSAESSIQKSCYISQVWRAVSAASLGGEKIVLPQPSLPQFILIQVTITTIHKVPTMYFQAFYIYCFI